MPLFHLKDPILFLGLDNVERLKSITFKNGTLNHIWIEEANQVSEYDFDQLNLRLRGQTHHSFQVSLSFNPSTDSHWLKRRFFDNPSWANNERFIHHSTFEDNQWLDAGYSKQLFCKKTRIKALS